MNREAIHTIFDLIPTEFARDVLKINPIIKSATEAMALIRDEITSASEAIDPTMIDAECDRKKSRA